MNIYDEFRHLAGGNADVLLLIEALESEQLEISQRRKIADAVWRAVCPSCPPGFRHLRDSFWGKCVDRHVWWGLWGNSPEQKAQWLREQRICDERETFAPGGKWRSMYVPIFQPMPRLPQPSAMRV